jgi:radical SAM superfamily enzyme YgiQ (UPF0313 family)
VRTALETEFGKTFTLMRGFDKMVQKLSDAIMRFFYPDDAAFFSLLQQFGIKPDEKDFKKADFLAKLKKSGLEWVGFGAESGSNRVLRLIKKGTISADVVGTVKNLKIIDVDADFLSGKDPRY